MISDIYAALIACKYKVSLHPQEKRPDREIVLILSDVDMSVQEPQLYHMPVLVALEWNDCKVLEIPTFIKTLCKNVEEYLFDNSITNRGTFRWVGLDIARPGGEQYNISLKCMYLEEVQID